MSILVVPEAVESLADLELVVDADGSTIPLDAIAGDEESYPTDLGEDRKREVTIEGAEVVDHTECPPFYPGLEGAGLDHNGGKTWPTSNSARTRSTRRGYRGGRDRCKRRDALPAR